MNDHAITSGVSIVLALIGLAIVAILVSSRSASGAVVKAGGSALSTALCTALSPVTGGGCIGTASSTINFGGL